MLMTSAGPVVLHGGVEILRSKGIAPHPDEPDGEAIRTEMALAPIYLKGRGDTYNLRTPNQFDWEQVGMTASDADAPGDVAGMHAFWKALIALRLSDHGAPFRIGGVVPEGHYRFIEPADPAQLGYVVDGSVLVLLNTGDAAASFARRPPRRPVGPRGGRRSRLGHGGPRRRGCGLDWRLAQPGGSCEIGPRLGPHRGRAG